MYTLDQLQCFITVAEHLHFGHAADELNMTQPPLSRQIQKLEKDVGTPLLLRNNRKVELTPAGTTFLRQARTILNSAENARQLARLSAVGLSGQIRIGYTTASGLSILGPLLSFIKNKIPAVQIEVFEMVTREQLEALENETIDVAVGRLEHGDEEHLMKEIHHESLVLAAPVDHPLMRQDGPLLREHIGGQPLIIYSPTRRGISTTSRSETSESTTIRLHTRSVRWAPWWHWSLPATELPSSPNLPSECHFPELDFATLKT